jgi:MOSC domain-containing protein YiiM
VLIEGLDFSVIQPGTELRIGEAIVEITGPCLPCERMDQTIGSGGRAAMADAGGLTARILQSGWIRIGAPVSVEKAGSNAAAQEVIPA